MEDQISAAEAKSEARAKQSLKESEIELKRRKQSLLLERTRIVREMEQAHKRRRLALLGRALAHIDAELAKFEDVDPRQ